VSPAVKGPIATFHPAVGSGAPRLDVHTSVEERETSNPMIEYRGVSLNLFDHLLVTAILLVTTSRIGGHSISLPHHPHRQPHHTSIGANLSPMMSRTPHLATQLAIPMRGGLPCLPNASSALPSCEWTPDPQACLTNRRSPRPSLPCIAPHVWIPSYPTTRRMTTSHQYLAFQNSTAPMCTCLVAHPRASVRSPHPRCSGVSGFKGD
jgi:hypothetical protein